MKNREVKYASRLRESDRHKKEFEKTWKKSLTNSTACANI